MHINTHNALNINNDKKADRYVRLFLAIKTKEIGIKRRFNFNII